MTHLKAESATDLATRLPAGPVIPRSWLKKKIFQFTPHSLRLEQQELPSHWHLAEELRVQTPCVQTRSRLPGTVWRGLFFFLRPTVHTTSSNAPTFRGQSRLSGFGCALGHSATTFSRMRTFDENSCAISITSPRSLSPPRTQHVWWDHREKSRRASTLGLPGEVLSGTLSRTFPGKRDLVWTRGQNGATQPTLGVSHL